MWRDLLIAMYPNSYVDTLTAVAELGGCDLVCTSPPYCNARTYGHGLSWSLEDYASLGNAVFKALKPGGHCLLNIDAPVRNWRVGIGTERGFHPWKVMIDWGERVGFRVPDRLAYGRRGIPGEYRGRFRNDWEPLLWFQRPGETGYFDRWPLASEAKYKAKVGQIATGRRPDGSMYSRRVSGKAAEEGVVHRGTMWEYGTLGKGHDDPILECAKHPARFSLRLATDIVMCFCPENGIVCDPFLGSGTTMVAAIENGRRFIGGDMLTRPDDGKRWIDVASEGMDQRHQSQNGSRAAV